MYFFRSPKNICWNAPSLSVCVLYTRARCRRHSEDLIQLYGKKGGGIVFVNLVDKKKEQGALGEAFDAALKAVADGAGRESAASGADKTASGYLPEGGGVGLEADTSSQAAVEEEEKAVENKGFDLADSLRHVWFDFHHEVRLAR